MKAQPGPMVSGSHFLPKAPLLWVKWMPASVVTSRKWIWAWAGRRSRPNAIKHGDRQARRNFERKLSVCVRDIIVNSLVKNIYREAPAEGAAGLCPAGPLDFARGRLTRAAVPTCVVVLTGSGT